MSTDPLNKQDLLLNLQATKKLTLDWEKLDQEYKEYFTKKIDLKELSLKQHIGLVVISFFGYGLIISMILSILRLFNDNVVAVIAVILAPSYLIWIPAYNRKYLNKKQIENADRIKRIPLEKSQIVYALEQKSIVPKKYWYSYALAKIEGYIQDFRADSLKESLNLFEEDVKHNDSIQQLINIQIQQEQLIIEMQDTQSEIRTNTYINMFK
jgi:hypothetical protein